MANDITLTQPDLVDRLRNNLPAGYTDATLKKPNAPWTTPTNTKWLRITVNVSPTDNVTPDGYQRTFGICTIDVFFPKGVGDKAQNADAKITKDLFNNQEFANTKTQEASILTGVEVESWFMVQVDVNFSMEGI